MFKSFYKKTRLERLEILKHHHIISEEDYTLLKNNTTLDVDIASQLSENSLATLALPFCLLPELTINDKTYAVPMVTEEPSVVAAASNASKIINQSGGFTTEVLSRLMIGQVALYDVENIEAAFAALGQNEEKLLTIANNAYPSIVNRGGGAKEISYDMVYENEQAFLVVYLTVDVKEAMGANIINTMLEAIKTELENLTQAKSLMAILSNYATKSLVKATCTINVSTLNQDLDQARLLAKRIALASQFAKADPYRAATHNKGIFNGIDALLIASGNDWRAIEAACHTYAAKDGKYQGLSTWTYDKDKEILKGELTLPMPVASVGGSIGLNNSVKIAHNILNKPDAKTLAQLIVALGLAQNFAALRALVSVGIQQGHMKLQKKSLLLSAGAKTEEIEDLLILLEKESHTNIASAKKIIDDYRNKK